MRVFAFIFCTGLSWTAFSQDKSLEIRFVSYLAGKPLKTDSLYVLGTDSIRVSQCRFYISALSVRTTKGFSRFSDEAILIDTYSDRNIAILLSDGGNGDKTLEFQFGTDSITNVSGALHGALDPMHGMYWAWQSGYINMKLEGKSSGSSDKKKEFEFHLGGYAAPYSSVQKISLPLPEAKEIVVVLDLDAFFQYTDLQKTHHIMRPCAEAVSLSRLLAANFRLL